MVSQQPKQWETLNGRSFGIQMEEVFASVFVDEVSRALAKN
jgi:hypothetical protein